MKSPKLSNLLKVAATAIGIISMTGTAANAFELSNGTTINTFLECLNDGVSMVVGSSAAQNGWYYATDASNDGSGGSPYEIYGMGVKETADSIIVALKANTPLIGNAYGGVADGNVGWGDMFFNFSGLNFMDAMNQGKLYGVKFAGTNDSGVANVGLYNGVTAKSVAVENSGYASINDYNSAHPGSNLGDLAANTNYFDKTKSLNVIDSGKFLSSINFLNNTQLADAGFNLNKFAGSETIAFKIAKSAVAVPEPGTLGGLALIGMTLAASKLRKQSAANQA
ncbi:PEP-CTERM sorting domain-containing protein [Argonema antarcticum]|uniref:PEP-CTERM sorting domain-containing protein n=1 Tax=Argonema antarcticum TaxID=2942763 RepID=UPI00201296A0|nr:PEP-CTERM sorting domain-containing protein [Argonema antarcticum]MCL1470038.1 PEP-CTERM sorting domain-containing protein [Argonema antarcticum A004/B2]